MPGIGICILKLAGIIFSLGYLITILALWIYQTGLQPYTYMVVGEPNLFIKYFEWILGIIAIGCLVMEGKRILDELGETLDRRLVVSYDPLV